MTTCRFEGCERKPAFPDQSRCEEHRIRFVPDAPAQPDKPEWVRRAQAKGLPYRVTGGSAA